MKKVLAFQILCSFLSLPAFAATPDYLIVETASPTHFSNGDTITFELVAFNNTTAAQDFTIVDDVPAGLIVTSVTGVAPGPVSPSLSSSLPFTGGASLSIGTTANPITIPANSAVTFYLNMQVNVNPNNGLLQTLTNTATLNLKAGSNWTTVSSNAAQGTACAGTDLSLQISDSNGNPPKGNNATFPTELGMTGR